MRMRKFLLVPALLLLLQAGAFCDGNPSLSPETEKEIAAGKDKFDHHKYEDAAKHFKKASKLEHESCLSCLVWLFRAQLSMGETKDALKTADRALPLAQKPAEIANVQLYRGVMFHRMSAAGKGKLADAETAFRAASTANPQCSECRFDLGLVLLKENKDSEGIEVLTALLPDYKNAPREREIRRFLADPGRARKDYAPEFSASLSSGESVDLDKLHGKVVLLDFWGSWCPPCRESVPALKSLAEKMDPEKVMIISVNEGDETEKWQDFVARNRMSWPQVYDTTGEMAETFNVHTYPHYFVIDKDGIISDKMSGWGPGEENTLKKAIEKALKN